MPNATLYGIPHSLYAGRARSYLIKAGIAYRELAPTTEHYFQNVLPKAGGRSSMPTLELADGQVIRDGAAIIDHFENETGHTFSPVSPKQRFFSRLFDVIGAEGLLRPAMHYRWNFDAENIDFLRFHMTLLSGGDAGLANKFVENMRRAARQFGVSPHTFELIETLYGELLAALDHHFENYPYLFGGRPSIGDSGMIAPLWGHLGRDPKPLSIMQSNGMHVLRWVERMNRHDADLVGFEDWDTAYLDGDELPDTLIDLLSVLAVDFVPETLAAAHHLNTWLDEQDDLQPGTVCKRGLGFASFELRGIPISALVQPYRFYLLKRAQDEYDGMGDDDRQAIDAILAASGMTPILDARLTRDIGRENNLEVWL